jgi:hypothetical protein
LRAGEPGIANEELSDARHSNRSDPQAGKISPRTRRRRRLATAASSLILAHASEKKDNGDNVAPTTRKFYLTGQKMELKAIAMEAWSDAVMAAYVKASGTPPMPRKHEFKRRRRAPGVRLKGQ